jgi:predicted dithiol-disulfide oxidoreductase (DUF899 family)
VFTKDPSGLRHFYSMPANHIDGSERGIDLLSPVWQVLDLLPQGRGNWFSGNGYPGRLRG